MGDIFTFDHDTEVKPVYGFGGGRRRASITAAANVEGAGSVSSLVATAKIAPGPLAGLFPHSEASSRAPSDTEKKPRRKRKNRKKKNGAAQPSPVVMVSAAASGGGAGSGGAGGAGSGGGEQGLKLDWSSFKKSVGTASSCSSRSSSPPKRSGLSSLLGQADVGDLVSVRGENCSSVKSGDGKGDEMGTYEVALDEDYVDEDVSSRPPSRCGADERRKMHAEDFETLKCLGKGT